MAIIDILSLDNVVLRGFITWSGILLIKVFLLGSITSYWRIKKGAVENEEDCHRPGVEIKKDEDVERVRRAHLNDLENAIPFVIIGFFYVLTDPNPVAALVLIRIAVIARILHSVVYAIYPVRQPARLICFFTALFITLYMLFATIAYFFQI